MNNVSLIGVSISYGEGKTALTELIADMIGGYQSPMEKVKQTRQLQAVYVSMRINLLWRK